MIPVELLASVSADSDLVRPGSTRGLTTLVSRQPDLKEAGEELGIADEPSSLTFTSREEVQDEIIKEVEMGNMFWEAPAEQLRQDTSIDQACEDPSTCTSTLALSSKTIIGGYDEDVLALLCAATHHPACKSAMIEPEPGPKQNFDALAKRTRRSTQKSNRHDLFEAPVPAVEQQLEPIVSQWPSKQITCKASIPEVQSQPLHGPEVKTNLKAPGMQTTLHNALKLPTISPVTIAYLEGKVRGSRGP